MSFVHKKTWSCCMTNAAAKSMPFKRAFQPHVLKPWVCEMSKKNEAIAQATLALPKQASGVQKLRKDFYGCFFIFTVF